MTWLTASAAPTIWRRSSAYLRALWPPPRLLTLQGLGRPQVLPSQTPGLTDQPLGLGDGVTRQIPLAKPLRLGRPELDAGNHPAGGGQRAGGQKRHAGGRAPAQPRHHAGRLGNGSGTGAAGLITFGLCQRLCAGHHGCGRPAEPGRHAGGQDLQAPGTALRGHRPRPDAAARPATGQHRRALCRPAVVSGRVARSATCGRGIGGGLLALELRSGARGGLHHQAPRHRQRQCRQTVILLSASCTSRRSPAGRGLVPVDPSTGIVTFARTRPRRRCSPPASSSTCRSLRQRRAGRDARSQVDSSAPSPPSPSDPRLKTLAPDCRPISTPAPRRRWCWKITGTDGAVFGFADHDLGVEIAGTRFEPEAASPPRASPGTISPVDAQDTEGVLRSRHHRTNILDGRWDNASPGLAGELAGDVRRRADAAIQTRMRSPRLRLAEVRSLALEPDSPVLRNYCDADLGDARCGVTLCTA